VSKHLVWWRRKDEVDTDVCIVNPGHAMKCQFLTLLPFRTKCIWRVGTQDRSRNGDQEGKIVRLPSSPVNTAKIGDALNPTKCHAVVSCVWCCAESANCSE
jgi:hypothetical protein